MVINHNANSIKKMNGEVQECHLDELGYYFVKKCIKTIETRGLDDQGLYRIGGVNSRVSRLLQMCLDRKNYNPATGRITMPDFSDPVEWETKTITSALKNYLRNLSEPLMTYDLHPSIIEAAKIENAETRTSRIKSLIQQLPVKNFKMLKILVEHLKNVASHSQKNLMTVSNLGICFAPTLMRGPEENASSIMEIKYSNVVANTLIEAYDSIFTDQNARYNNTTSNSQNQFEIGLPIYYYPMQHTNRVITLYACIADNPSELSFGPNEIVRDVRYSAEVGWLVGTLERNGMRGLLPENYVKFI